MTLWSDIAKPQTLKTWYLAAIVAMTMSGCMTTNVLGNGPVLTMDSGILVNQKKFRVPFLDGADIMVFSPDNRYLVTSGSYSHHINVYDIERGEIVKRFPREDKKRNWEISRLSVAFTSDSKYLVLRNIHSSKAVIGKFHLVDLKTFEVVRTVITGTAGGYMYFSQDGKYLAFKGGSSLSNNPKAYGKSPIINLYDAVTWDLINDDVKKGYDSDAGVVFTPDGRYMVDVAKLGHNRELTRDMPPVIRIWSLPDLKIVRTIDGLYAPGATIGDIQLSHDGRLLAMLSKNEETIEGLGGTLLVELKTGNLLNDYNGPSGYLGFSTSSKYLFSSTGTHSNAIIYILDIETFEVLEKVTQKQGRAEIETAYSPDGSKVALSNGREFYIWDVKE